MTSKEYWINCQVLLKHFELAFIQLQLLKISCKLLIIWVNYEKNKKGSFLWNTTYTVKIILIICRYTLVEALTEAPLSSRNRIMLIWPKWHAECNGV